MYNRSNLNPNPSAAVKTLITIHTLVTAGLIFFAVIAFVITPQKGFVISTDALIITDILLTASGIIIGNRLYKTLVGKIPSESPLSQRVAKWQRICIRRFAFVEGPALFSFVLYLRVGNLFFLAILLLLLAYLISVRPTRSKLIDDLRLDYNEQGELDSSSNNPTI